MKKKVFLGQDLGRCKTSSAKFLKSSGQNRCVMLYTDGSHLIADSLMELFQYAYRIGLNAQWVDFMGRTFHPHFDICGNVKRRVLKDKDVKQVSTRELVKLLKLNYRLPETDTEEKEWEAHHEQAIKDLPMPSEKDYNRMFDEILKKTGLKK